MELYRTKELFDRNNLKSINDNWKEIEDTFEGTDERIFKETWEKIKNNNTIKMMEPVEKYEDLPTIAQPSSLITVIEEQKVYAFVNEEWIPFSVLDLDPYTPFKNDLENDLSAINEAEKSALENINALNPIDHTKWQKSKLTNDNGTVLHIENFDFELAQNSIDKAGMFFVTNALNSPVENNEGYIDTLLKDELNMQITFSPLHSEEKLTRSLIDGVWGEWDNKSAELKKIYGLTNLGVNIYVDNINGSDNEGDGKIDSPYATVQKAFDNIPKVIDKRWTVNIAPGEYDEEAYLTGVIGGAIYVKSTPNDKPDVSQGTDVRIRSLNFYDVIGYVHIEDVSPLGLTQKKGFILFSRCIYGSVSRCRLDRYIGDLPTMYWDGSYGSFGTSYMTNQYLCVQSQNGSTVRVEHSIEAGGNNINSLYALNGFIFKRGNTDWIEKALTPEIKENGGKIYEDFTWNELSLKNSWVVNSGLPLRVKKISDDFAFLYGWVNKGTLDTSVIAQLPAKYTPIHTQRNPVAVTGTSNNQEALPILDIKKDGDIQLVNTGNLPSNLGLAINITYPIR